MNKTIGILAHVDAGKTTFAEGLLYHTESIRTRGRVDHKDTFLDNHQIEKERGITVFSKQAVFKYKDSVYYLVDTPGHVDFSSEMERALMVMDYAIVIISAAEGIQGHTETVWELLRKCQIPTFFFINKTDRIGADPVKVINDIKVNLTQDICCLTGQLKEGQMEEALIECIAERDEKLFDSYMEQGYDQELWLQTMQRMIKQNKIFPCASGSALQDTGITDFLEQLDTLTLTDYQEDASFAGRVYKIGHDEKGMRITYIKALSGTLKVRQTLSSGDSSPKIRFKGENFGDGSPNIGFAGENSRDSSPKMRFAGGSVGDSSPKLRVSKVSQLRIYNGNKYEAVEEVRAGQLFAAVGLTEEEAGEGLGACGDKISYQMIPTLQSKVIFDKSLSAKEVLRLFKLLDAEDPALHVMWNEPLQEIHIQVMGSIQLEVLKELVKERFQLEVDFGPCEILYKETIEEETVGRGHFEPLKHYAEVHVRITPLPRNSGVVFESQCHTDDLQIGHQNLVGTHILERAHHGLLTGSALTDIKVTLLTGRAHNKHTSGGDFREASCRALRQGLEKVRNRLLEPYYRFRIQAELDLMGRIISDIQKLHGSFDTPQTLEDKVIITGRAPTATFMNYSLELAAYTKGKGSIALSFDGYDFCHNEKEVIENRGYDKEADSEYSSSSIFCSKGQAYKVSWDEADDYMHCELKNKY